MTPAITMATPMTDASPTRPGRTLYIQNPVRRAAGIVTTMVNIPQALSLRAFTTTMLTLARMAMTMKSVATEVVKPDTRPMEWRAILGRGQAVLAHRRPEDDEVVNPTREAGTDDDPDEAGQIAPLRREHRADKRPRPRDGREVVAEEHHPVGGMVVHAVLKPVGGCGARIVERGYLCCEKSPVGAIRDGKRAECAEDKPEGIHGANKPLHGNRSRVCGNRPRWFYTNAPRAAAVQSKVSLNSRPQTRPMLSGDGSGGSGRHP